MTIAVSKQVQLEMRKTEEIILLLRAKQKRKISSALENEDSSRSCNELMSRKHTFRWSGHARRVNLIIKKDESDFKSLTMKSKQNGFELSVVSPSHKKLKNKKYIYAFDVDGHILYDPTQQSEPCQSFGRANILDLSNF